MNSLKTRGSDDFVKSVSLSASTNELIKISTTLTQETIQYNDLHKNLTPLILRSKKRKIYLTLFEFLTRAEISEGLAGILSRLGIEPMEVGLNIKAIYEGGTIYNRAILDVDEDAILADLKGAASDCFKLAVGLEYMTLCILLSAVMQGLFGVFRLAKTADLVSEQVLSGFLNG